jgi:hypothetical protein
MNANRRDCTLGRPCEPRNRRERLNCLVHHSTLTANELSDRIGCRYDRLIAYASVNGTDEMPLRHLMALTRETGRSFALEAEAHECGFLLVSQQLALGSVDPMRELLDVFDAAGKLASSFRVQVAARDPESLRDVIACARRLQTEVAEFVHAAETAAPANLLRAIR